MCIAEIFVVKDLKEEVVTDLVDKLVKEGGNNGLEPSPQFGAFGFATTPYATTPSVTYSSVTWGDTVTTSSNNYGITTSSNYRIMGEQTVGEQTVSNEIVSVNEPVNAPIVEDGSMLC